MFPHNPTKTGPKLENNGLYGTMHEYQEGPEPCLMKRIVIKDNNKFGKCIQTFSLGFNTNHPCILKYNAFSVQEEKDDKDDKVYNTVFYYYMKAMKKNLKKFIEELKPKEGEKRHLPQKNVVLIFYQLASALAFLESKNIVHRNISHDSVLFDGEHDEIIKLSGFAFSKFDPSNDDLGRTLSYWPPERFTKTQQKANQASINEEEKQKRVKMLAFKSDVWCLGKLIIDICLLQEKILKQKTPEEIIAKVHEDLSKVEKQYEKSLVDVLRLMLDPVPENRISFEDICKKLSESFLGDLQSLPDKGLRQIAVQDTFPSLSHISHEHDLLEDQSQNPDQNQIIPNILTQEHEEKDQNQDQEHEKQQQEQQQQQQQKQKQEKEEKGEKEKDQEREEEKVQEERKSGDDSKSSDRSERIQRVLENIAMIASLISDTQSATYDLMNSESGFGNSQSSFSSYENAEVSTQASANDYENLFNVLQTLNENYQQLTSFLSQSHPSFSISSISANLTSSTSFQERILSLLALLSPGNSVSSNQAPVNKTV